MTAREQPRMASAATRLAALILLLSASRLAGQSAPLASEQVPGTLISFELVPVSAGSAALPGGRVDSVAAFEIMASEVSWDLYDVYVFGLDRGDRDSLVNAVSRPSKPYVLPGEKFGHEGHPALGMTWHAASQFAEWLSRRTGREYRIPTEAEWTRACLLGQASAESPGAAWTRANSGGRTRRVGESAPDQLGLHDMLGNAAEWVARSDSSYVAAGGSWSDAADAVNCEARKQQTSAWNMTDPQMPKSSWWLPDAPFVGLRLVRDPASMPKES